MNFAILTSLNDVEADQWNALVGADNPFARHEFLNAMERHEAVGEKFGWYPQYLLAYDQAELVGAAPLYLKDNSYGELVFDWSWADAYSRAGLKYYPKLVVAIPYTPAAGQRLLVKENPQRQAIATALIDAATEHAKKIGVSSLHWLFTNTLETDLFRQHPEYMLRLGCQFHWQNQGYVDFDDYLRHFSAQRRKKIRRERRFVSEQDITIDVLQGDEVSDEQWALYHQFYKSTFNDKYGYATFSEGFFREIGRTMPENILLMMARQQQGYVASAFNIKGAETLFGRHWGCNNRFHSLHFETCYYQGLEYCITHGLQRFEPGAQGEHKIWRGFLPTRTWSAHWIADAKFQDAIANYLEHETLGMEQYLSELQTHSPFKKTQQVTTP